jgi:hypothetical protein
MKKVIIDSKYKKDILVIQKYIDAHHSLVDSQIKLLSEKMGITDRDEYEILWDHIVNDFNYCVEYKKDSEDKPKAK